MKDFYEALKDGYKPITEVTDPDWLRQLRRDGIQVDLEPMREFSFGERGEYQLVIEPILAEDHFFVALYKHRVQLTEKLPIIAWKKTK